MRVTGGQVFDLEQGFVSRDVCTDGALLTAASGEDKADAVYNAFCGPIDPHCPASILQLHNDVILVGDKAALSKLVAAGVHVCE